MNRRFAELGAQLDSVACLAAQWLWPTPRARGNAAEEVLGLPLPRPHDLRGTFASLMAEELGLFATSRRLGHSSVKTTEKHYARVFERENAEQDERLAAREAAARARRGTTGVTPLRAVP